MIRAIQIRALSALVLVLRVVLAFEVRCQVLGWNRMRCLPVARWIVAQSGPRQQFSNHYPDCK
jgi:hypothetical protein